MSRGAGGRPAAIRSQHLTGAGQPMTQQQRRDVWGVLLGGYYDDPAETGLLDQLDDDFASYQAAADAWAKEASPGDEAADLVAIGKDCRQLAAAVPGVVADTATWPRTLCSRLNDRLQCFPSSGVAALYEAGVDIWPLEATLRAWVLRPRYWHDNPGFAADLLRMADACDACKGCSPLGARTKPFGIARHRFVKAIRAAMDRWPPGNGTVTERNALINELLGALNIPAPKRI